MTTPEQRIHYASELIIEHVVAVCAPNEYKVFNYSMLRELGNVIVNARAQLDIMELDQPRQIVINPEEGR